MPVAVASQQLRTTAGFEHRDQIVRDEEGNVISSRLVCQHLDIKFPALSVPPTAPASANKRCIKKYKEELDDWLSLYKRELDFFELLCLYDQARMSYVYKHRHDDIEEKYRTGEDSPTSIMGVIKEIAKLKIKK